MKSKIQILLFAFSLFLFAGTAMAQVPATIQLSGNCA
jgi:hypothetical protein